MLPLPVRRFVEEGDVQRGCAAAAGGPFSRISSDHAASASNFVLEEAQLRDIALVARRH